jgi:hypothetical protein
MKIPLRPFFGKYTKKDPDKRGRKNLWDLIADFVRNPGMFKKIGREMKIRKQITQRITDGKPVDDLVGDDKELQEFADKVRETQK